MKREKLIKFIAEECENTVQDMLGDPDNYGLSDEAKVDGVLLEDLDWKEVMKDVADVMSIRAQKKRKK